MSSDRSGPLRVLHVLDNFGFGGTERGVANLINRMDPERIETGICIFRKVEADASRQRLERDDVFIRSVNKRFGNDPRIAWRIARLIREGGFDIVHSHAWATYVETRVALWLQRAAVGIHGEHGTSYLDAGRRRWAFGFFSGGFDRFLFVSEHLKDQFADKTSIDAGKMQVIPNGVDFSLMSPEGPSMRDGNDAFANGWLHIGTAGRFRDVKNHQLLLDFALRCKREGKKIKLHFAGDGELRPDYERFIREHDLSDRVHLHGKIQYIPPFYRALDLYVLSSHSEGHPNALLEAIAAGLPVASTPVGDVARFLEHDKTGFLFPHDDVDALGRIVDRWDDERELFRAVTEAGYHAARERFDITVMVEAYARAYEETYARSRSPQLTANSQQP